MNQYMVEIELPRKMTSDFVQLIPRQRQMVNELLHKEVITSYTLSSNRSRLWVTFAAPSEDAVLDILGRFPIRRFMRFTITEAMFHEHAHANLPAFSLN
jgi:muconolactone delta-isomerase